MLVTVRNKPSKLNAIVGFLVWAALFAIAYAQAPLYTSNQNQYFLHAYARLGYGYLDHDWLANTLDPTPVFSELGYLTMRFLGLRELFYIYYALLMGIYLVSLLGIANEFWIGDRELENAKTPPPELSKDLASDRGEVINSKWLALLGLLFLAHSAAWRFGLARLLGDNWSYIIEDGVADQRMLGPVFQPSAFGVFLALSAALFLRRKTYLAVLATGLAAIFHATYVLPSGMLTLAYMYVTWKEKRNPVETFLIGLVALLAVSPALYYAINIFSATSPEATSQARQILVEFRIPHHALISQWLDATVAVKVSLISFALYLARKRRLFWVLFIPAILSVILTLIQAITANLSLAILFPWRVSILLVPLAVTVILARIVEWLHKRMSSMPERCTHLLAVASLGLIAMTVLVGAIRFSLDLERKSNLPERGLYHYVSLHKQTGEVFLIPVKMQDFRLETGAPVYIDFKSIPYQDNEIVEWYRRNQLANRFYHKPDCAMLPQLRIEGIDAIILPANQTVDDCPGLKLDYQDEAYRLFSLVIPDYYSITSALQIP